jgi:hypothetical protein
LTGAGEAAWNEVQRIWIDRETWKVGMTSLSSTTLVKHFVLMIQFNDYKDLQVLVPTSKTPFIEKVMQRHPRFRDSPHDEC